MTQSNSTCSNAKIWTFIGYILLIYGVLIGGVGILHWATNQPFHTALASMHPNMLWGTVMFITGAIFCWFNRDKTSKINKIT